MFFWPSQSPISCALPAPVGTARVDVKFEQSRYHGLHALKAGDFAPPPFDGFAFVYVRPALSRIGGNAGLTRITASRFAVDYVTNLCASWLSERETGPNGRPGNDLMSVRCCLCRARQLMSLRIARPAYVKLKPENRRHCTGILAAAGAYAAFRQSGKR
jgi:hypothetical protein